MPLPNMIDAHHHLWTYNKRDFGWISPEMSAIASDFTPHDARTTFSAYGITGTVVVQARQTEAETHLLLDIARGDCFFKGVVGWIDLESTDLEDQLNAFSGQPKLVGFRHVLQDETDNQHVLRPDFMHGLRQIAKHGYRYDVLIYEHQLAGALEMMRQIPELPCVIDHIAKPKIDMEPTEHWRSLMRTVANETHAYCKLSGIVTEANWSNWSYETFARYLEHVFQTFGPKRVMFGSDWPVCLLSGDYGQVKAIVDQFVQTYCPLYAEDVFAKNAITFYGLESAA